MDQENDIGYYRRREAASRQMAAGSTDVAIRRIHAEMAERYAAKIDQAMLKPRLNLA